MEEEKYPSKLTKGASTASSAGAGRTSSSSPSESSWAIPSSDRTPAFASSSSPRIRSWTGTLRIIPAMAVLIIDVLNYKHEEDRLKKEPDSIFYN